MASPLPLRSTRCLAVLQVFLSVKSEIANWFDRHTSQEVCSWNHKFSHAATEPAFAPRAELIAPDLAAFAMMDDAEFKSRFGDTPLSRAKRAGLVRNATRPSASDGD